MPRKSRVSQTGDEFVVMVSVVRNILLSAPLCRIQRPDTVTVHVDKGAQDGQRIVHRGDGDNDVGSPCVLEWPQRVVAMFTRPCDAVKQVGTRPGNRVFTLTQVAHATFLRKGDDLALTHKLQLVEALSDAKVVFRHLDGRMIVLALAPPTVVQPGMLSAVPATPL